MIKSSVLSDLDIDFLLNLPEVTQAKERINNEKSNSIYFNVTLPQQMKEYLSKYLEIDLSNVDNIPMRWIKGDTHPHIDRSSNLFNKTHLVYLTDSQGELLVEGASYPITKRAAYTFSEGMKHETVGTGSEPRLLLGPMSEVGISVGGPSISGDGATDIVYIRDNSGTNEYKINNGSWNTLFLPVTVANTNPDPANNLLKIIFTTEITFNDSSHFFYVSSEGIQFGSTSLNNDGTRAIINIDTTTDYNGLINNNFGGSSTGYNNIYVFNLEVRATGGAALDTDGGWIGQPSFGKSASNNFIVNCSSNGPIIDGGGGIVGAYSGSESGASLYIIGCSSSGNSSTYSGGIAGMYAGRNGGQVICESCWSQGSIGDNGGGIIGYEAGNNGGYVNASKCYSTGAISGADAGGIFGQLAGTSATIDAIACYSQGVVSGIDAGGIYGNGAASAGGVTNATNCYSLFGTTDGIYSGGVVGSRNANNCYVAVGLLLEDKIIRMN